jgi:hypothetical protein
MAQGDHDDLADALAKLAGGEIAPSEHEPPAPPAQPPAPPPPAKPAPGKPQFRQAAPPPTRPPAPKPSASAPSAAARPQRPGAPIRPTTPTAKPASTPPLSPAPRPQRPTTPSTRPSAPGSPNLTSPEPPPVDNGISTVTPLSSEEQPVVIDDDDAVIVPAPDASVFAPKPIHHRHIGLTHGTVYQTVEFRRTIIPILLTCGVLMIAFGLLKPLLGQDSPLADLPGWLPIVLFAAGALLLGLAVLNMLSVRQQLADMRK